MNALPEIAIYDMDRTVTRHGTYTPFLIHAASRLAPWRLLLLPAALVAMAAYAMKLITRGRLKEINQHLLLGPHIAPSELEPVTRSFAEQVERRNVLPGARRQIATDKAAGRRLVIATASYRLYAEAIAERLGFDDVIATNSIIGLDSRVTAKIDGENCYGPAKLRMIQAWMQRRGIARDSIRVRFYSDHASDAPVMAWADEAIAANPGPKMRRLAQRQGWEIVRWAT